jgi:hypothetical protein
MKIIHQIVLSIFVAVATYSQQVVHGAKDCSYDGYKTNHNGWYEGPDEKCRCDDGKWKDCSSKNDESEKSDGIEDTITDKKTEETEFLVAVL